MKCPNCGNKIKKNELFCTNCGSKIEKAMSNDNAAVEKDKPEKSGNNVIKIIGITTAVVILILVSVLIALLVAKNAKKTDKGTGEESLPEAGAENISNSDISGIFVDSEELDEVEPLLTSLPIPEYNFTEVKHSPQTKSAGMTWDGTLFYWLEDTDEDYEDEGNISGCNITKYLIRNAETRAINEYNVYRDGKTDVIYKIVAIEKTGDDLKLTDYYYVSGKPNFIFTRKDRIYTPVYASPEITGQRFYFNNDVMVRWRTIEVPNEIGEYTLTTRNVKYAQLDYFKQPEDTKKAYDTMENIMLNEAYNVYDAVCNADNVGVIKANVHDISMNAIADATVEVLRADDDALLYRTKTDENGNFEINVALDNTKCYVRVRSGKEYNVEIIFNIYLDSAYPIISHGNIVMHKEGETLYKANLSVYDSSKVACNASDDGSKSTVLPAKMTGITCNVRRGMGMQEGDIEQTVTSDSSGNITVNVAPGTYTIEVVANGYNKNYYELEVSDSDVSRNCFMIPTISSGKRAVLLTWDNTDIDLDLTIFTPYQSSNGNMAHIGIDVLNDSYGNSIVSDNSAFCELAYVNDNDKDNFKLYVNDYTDSMAKNFSADVLSKINVHIYIYDSNGLVAEYTVPLSSIGTVWEVVEFNKNKMIPQQRVYSQSTEKSWWCSEKRAVAKKKTLKSKTTYTQNNVQYEEYDQHGNIKEVKEGETLKNISTSATYKNTYNNNLLIRQEGSDGLMTEYTKYDEHGNVIEEIEYIEGKPSTKTIHEYKYSGNIMTNHVYYYLYYFEDIDDWGPGNMGFFEEYDAQGRLTYTSHDISEVIYLYDSNVPPESFLKDDNSFMTSICYCNKYGDLEGEYWVSENGIDKTRYKYEYDYENNRHVCESEVYNWSEGFHEEKLYDDEHNLLCEIHISEYAHEVTRYEYYGETNIPDVSDIDVTAIVNAFDESNVNFVMGRESTVNFIDGKAEWNIDNLSFDGDYLRKWNNDVYYMVIRGELYEDNKTYELGRYIHGDSIVVLYFNDMADENNTNQIGFARFKKSDNGIKLESLTTDMIWYHYI